MLRVLDQSCSNMQSQRLTSMPGEYCIILFLFLKVIEFLIKKDNELVGTFICNHRGVK